MYIWLDSRSNKFQLVRFIARVQRLLEKLVKFCDSPNLGLKRSPPYLLDLLPHMFQVRGINSLSLSLFFCLSLSLSPSLQIGWNKRSGHLSMKIT